MLCTTSRSVDEIGSAMNELGWDILLFDHEDGRRSPSGPSPTERGVHVRTGLVFFRMMVGEIAL